MAETIIKGTITSVSNMEGDTDKGHWMRQDCVIVPVSGGRPVHFQVSGKDRINMCNFVQGQQYVVRLYLESQEGTDRNGKPMWFDKFICGGTLTEQHSQYYENCMYKLRDPQFYQNYQMEAQRRYAAVNQPQGYVQQAQVYQPMQQPQGYGNQYVVQPQPYQQLMQDDQSNIPF